MKGVRDGLNRIQPPLGPMIAAELMRRQGHRVRIYDAALVGWNNQTAVDDKTVLIGQTDSEIENVITEFAPDVIGMFVHTLWILGHPGDTYQEMQETARFAMDCGADSFSVAILSPLPGTPAFRQVVAAPTRTKGV